MFQEKLIILQKMETMGWTQMQTASYYNNKGYGTWVSQVNISCWLKDKQKMETHVGDGGVNPTTHCICSVWYPELEAAPTNATSESDTAMPEDACTDNEDGTDS